MVAEKFIAHSTPLWGEKSDSQLAIDLNPYGLPGVEECPARHVEDQLYEVCCIPFFSYGIRLGDVVRANPAPGGYGRLFIERVVESGGRLNLRLVARDEKEVASSTKRALGLLAQLGCGVEQWAPGYLAADVPSEDVEGQLLRGLHSLIDHGLLSVERI